MVKKIIGIQRGNDDWFDEEYREATRRKNQAYLIM